MSIDTNAAHGISVYQEDLLWVNADVANGRRKLCSGTARSQNEKLTSGGACHLSLFQCEKMQENAGKWEEMQGNVGKCEKCKCNLSAHISWYMLSCTNAAHAICGIYISGRTIMYGVKWMLMHFKNRTLTPLACVGLYIVKNQMEHSPKIPNHGGFPSPTPAVEALMSTPGSGFLVVIPNYCGMSTATQDTVRQPRRWHNWYIPD